MGTEKITEAIELLVDPATADRIKKSGMAEIALRRKDQKFNSFIKAKIENSGTSQEATRQIMDAVRGTTTNKQIAAGMHKTVNGINLANKNLAGIDAGIKNVSHSIESVLNLSKKVANLSCVQLALSAANMTVDIAGFVLISNKLDGLNKRFDQIEKQIGELKDIKIEEMREKCDNLCLNYSSIATKIRDGNIPAQKDLEEYLSQAKPFLSKLNHLLFNKTVDTEVLLNMIFTMLPAYTSILCIFLRAYYFENKSTPLTYDSFLKIYQEINGEEFRNSVQDYYLLEKNFDYRDVIDILNVQLSTVFGERLEIDDQLELISIFSTDEEYLAFEKQLEAAVEKEAKERAEEIASRCGEFSDECRRVLATEG